MGPYGAGGPLVVGGARSLASALGVIVFEALTFLVLVHLAWICHGAYEQRPATTFRAATLGFSLLALTRFVRVGYFTTLLVDPIPVPGQLLVFLTNSALMLVGFGGLLYAIYVY